MIRSGAAIKAIPNDFDPDSLDNIRSALQSIRQREAVAIGLAVESGSRAWGFPSPDSDYDVRLIFIRHADDYLSPWQRRDVIEVPLHGDLDLNGWDLGKAIKLLVKGNAVIIEWLMSPIVYAGDASFYDDLSSFAARHTNRTGVARRYLHLGERQRRTYFADGRAIQLKKIFYALRPAAALRWLRLHPDEAIAPMHFPTLMSGCDPPPEVQRITDDLIARKALTRELGTATLPPAIEHFIDEEFATTRETLPPSPVGIAPETRIAADALYRRAVARASFELGSTPPMPDATTAL